MPKSTRRRAAGKAAKPSKPYHDFPLFPHASGRWAKKIKGNLHYFGRWGNKVGNAIVPVEDVEASAVAAKDELDRTWTHIVEGRTPPPADAGAGFTIRDLCDEFLQDREAKLDTGELSLHSFAEYKRTTDRIFEFFGRDRRVDDLRPDDFRAFRAALAKGCSVVTLKSKVNRTRVVFKFAHDNRFIPHPVEYGTAFDRPSEKSMRTARADAGERMFEADELRRIIESAAQPLKAMVLLALNTGFGNTDIASLPLSAVDLKAGWANFARVKTGVARRCPLWPETVEAIRESLKSRPQPVAPEDADLVFVTSRGTRFVRIQESKTTEGAHVTINSLSRRFESLLHELKINGRRGLGFYTLRHVFETIGGECRDQVAVNALMGHVDSSMGGQYRERISDERLQAVVDQVRGWLWPSAR